MAGETMPAKASLERLPKYLAYLKIKRKQGATAISSTRIAEDLRLTSILVRKDLALASRAGRPKTGYPVDTLIADLEHFLGYDNAHEAFLVGAGQLGRALLGYTQFAEYGLNILAAFDVNAVLHGTEIGGKPIFPLEKLPDLATRMRVRIGVLAVPDDAAQAACTVLAQSGFRAIWNFSSVHLEAPAHVLIQNENLAASFAGLCNRLAATDSNTHKGESR